ncbi:hypothetical protein ECZU29_61860 [Escherichia coli]|nr:hypothetical protein ECZU29_61860 [Escherichia coli]
MASRTCCPKPVGARSAVSPWISRRSSCRAVRSDLFVQIDRGKDANAGLTVSAGVMGGGTADQIIDAPLVGVDPLDDTGPA